MQTSTRPGGEIRALTGLRGVAALWVVSYHLYVFSDRDGANGPGRIVIDMVRHGYLAVDVFFVLSGLVMAMSYARMFDGGFDGRQYLVFLVRRLARVWPLYATLTCCYAVLLLASGHTSPTEMSLLLPVNLAMMQSWGLGRTIDHPGWSVSAEFGAYLLFPALVWLSVFACRRIAAATGLLCLLALILLTELAQSPDAGNGPLDIWRPGTLWPMLRCLSEFTLGLLTWRVMPTCRDLCSRIGAAGSWALALGLLALIATPGTDLLVVMLVPPLLLQLTLLRRGPASILGTRPVHFLGLISYAIYLLHWALLPLQRLAAPLRTRFGDGGARLAILVLFFALLLLAATLAYRLIERPGRRWLRGLGERLSAAAPDAAADGPRSLRKAAAPPVGVL